VLLARVGVVRVLVWFGVVQVIGLGMPAGRARRSQTPAGRTRSATNLEASGAPSAPSRQATAVAACSPALSISCRSDERRWR
jgi:hypothetical protein